MASLQGYEDSGGMKAGIQSQSFIIYYWFVKVVVVVCVFATTAHPDNF